MLVFGFPFVFLLLFFVHSVLYCIFIIFEVYYYYFEFTWYVGVDVPQPNWHKA